VEVSRAIPAPLGVDRNSWIVDGVDLLPTMYLCVYIRTRLIFATVKPHLNSLRRVNSEIPFPEEKPQNQWPPVPSSWINVDTGVTAWLI